MMVGRHLQETIATSALRTSLFVELQQAQDGNRRTNKTLVLAMYKLLNTNFNQRVTFFILMLL